MRIATVNRQIPLGGLLIVSGVAVAALAIVLLVLGGPRGEHGATPLVAAGPSPETNGVVAFWEERVASDPADYVAHSKLAAAYIRRAREADEDSDYSRARAAVDESLRLSPADNFVAIVLLASVQNSQHDFAGAIETAQEAIAIDPGDPAGYAALGDAQIALGSYDEAQSNYERVISQAPGITSFTRLAHILEMQGDVNGADLAWRNAFATDGGRRPDNTAWAHVQYGDFKFRLGRLDEARAQYESAADVLPSYINGLAALARINAAEGDLGQAIGMYEEVVARKPHPEHVAALGDLYAAAGRLADAEEQYALLASYAEDAKANDGPIDLHLWLALADHGLELDEAVRHANVVYESRPDDVYSADAFAWALYKSGRSAEAAPYAERAIRLGTPDPALYFHAGMIAHANGDRESARELLGTAADLNPEFAVLHADELRDTLAELV